MRTNDGWVTRNFVALPPGWMAKYGTAGGAEFTCPLPGVLIQEHVSDGSVRVVAAEFCGSEVEPLKNTLDEPEDNPDLMALGDIYYEHRNSHRESRETPPVEDAK